jgi:hypothetical protein
MDLTLSLVPGIVTSAPRFQRRTTISAPETESISSRWATLPSRQHFATDWRTEALPLKLTASLMLIMRYISFAKCSLLESGVPSIELKTITISASQCGTVGLSDP